MNIESDPATGAGSRFQRSVQLPGAALLFATAMAASDLLVNMLNDTGRLDELSEFSMPAGATGLLAFALFLFLILPLKGVTAAGESGGGAPKAVLAIVLGIGFLWFQALEAYPYLKFNLRRDLTFLNLFLAVAGHLYLLRARPSGSYRVYFTLSVGIAYVVAFANLASWFYLDRIEHLAGTELTDRLEKVALVSGFLGALGLSLSLGGVLGTRLKAGRVVRVVSRNLLPLAALFLMALALQLWNRADGNAARIPSWVRFLVAASPIAFVATLGIALASKGRRTLEGATACCALLVLVAGMISARIPALELVGASPYRSKEGGPRRIILITADTLRADVLTPYGGERIEVPNLARLAEGSTVFENTLSTSSWTFPSIGSMMSGTYPGVFGMMLPTSRVPGQASMLAERLAEAGYFTGAVVMNPALRPSHGMAQGFLDYTIYPQHRRPRTLGGRLIETLQPELYVREPTTAQLADRGIEWLQRYSDRDFFFWIHILDPHAPWGPPEPFRPDSEPVSGIIEPWDYTQAFKRGEIQLDEDEREWLFELYLQEVRYVDANVGRVLDEIRSLGLYDDAAILFASDHGEEFWEHGNFSHGHAFYQEVVHVPLMIKLPGQQAGRRIERPVSLVSVSPTLLDIAHVDYDPVGYSDGPLTPLLLGETEDGSSAPLFMESAFQYDRVHGMAVHFKQYKFMTGRDGVGPPELFDLVNDPGELENLADSRPDLVQEAQGLIEAFHQRNVELRGFYGVPDIMEEAELLPEEIEALRKLGYLE